MFNKDFILFIRVLAAESNIKLSYERAKEIADTFKNHENLKVKS